MRLFRRRSPENRVVLPRRRLTKLDIVEFVLRAAAFITVFFLFLAR